MRLLKRLPKRVKRKSRIRKPTTLPKQMIKHGGIPPTSESKWLPISDKLRIRLSKANPIYQYNKNQEHSTNIKIIEHYLFHIVTIIDYTFINYHQVTEGIILKFHYNNGIMYHHYDGIYVGKHLTIKVIMKYNAVRQFIFIINNDKILDRTHDCKKSCYYPESYFS